MLSGLRIRLVCNFEVCIILKQFVEENSYLCKFLEKFNMTVNKKADHFIPNMVIDLVSIDGVNI